MRALVTGANGGFGRCVVRRLLAGGWEVDAVVRGGAARLGLADPRLRVIDLDLDEYAREGRPVALADRLDALVNIAGTSVFGPVATLPLADYRALHRLNVEAPYLLVQAHLPALIRARGVVVNTSSLAAVVTAPFYGPYAATKRALEAWSEALAAECAPLGVRVVCLQPGSYRTGVTARMRFADGPPELADDLRRFRAFVTGPGTRVARDPDEFAGRVLDAIEGRRTALLQPLGAGASAARLASWLPWGLRTSLVRAAIRWGS